MTADLLHEMGPVLIALTALVIPAGGGCWKVWSYISGRFAELENSIEECKKRDAEKDLKLHTMGLCLRLLIPEVTRLDAGSQVLSQVRALLDESFPVDDDTPSDMLKLLERIDRAPRRRRTRTSD